MTEDDLLEDVKYWHGTAEALAHELEELKNSSGSDHDRLADALDVLKPFADIADQADDSRRVMQSVGIDFDGSLLKLVELCRAARAFLNMNVSPATVDEPIADSPTVCLGCETGYQLHTDTTGFRYHLVKAERIPCTLSPPVSQERGHD